MIWHQQASESQLELQDAQVQPADLKLAPRQLVPCQLAPRQLDALHPANFPIEALDAFQHAESEMLIAPPISSPISSPIPPQNEVARSKLSAIKKLG